MRPIEKLHWKIGNENLTLQTFIFVLITTTIFSHLSVPDPNSSSVESPEKMLRHAPRLLSRASATAMRWGRPFATQAEGSVDRKFLEAWKSANPNLDPPKTPAAFMAPRPPTPSTIPSKLTINFVLPYSSVFSAKEVC